ncbi:MAG: glycosyltransferase family 39 protein [Ilumatobacteraceae bacterium]
MAGRWGRPPDLHAIMTAAAAPLPPADPVWRRGLVRAAIAYAFSRLCVVVGAALVAAELRADENYRLEKFPLARWADPYYWNKPIPTHASGPMLDVLTSWDGLWYLRIVRAGYPTSVRPHVTYDVADARAAFFPAYPMLVRVADRLLPGGDVAASLLVNLVLGGVVVWLTGLLARRAFGDDVAVRAMVLVAMFPGSFVLSFAYTEALLLAAVTACLLALHERRWLTAGLLAAIASATRPNGVAIVAACAVAAVLAIRDRREWRSLVAVLLAPLGFVVFQWWLGRHTGEPGVWFRVQTEAWGEGASFGLTALRRTWRAIASPLTSPTNVITAVSLVTTVLLVWFARRVRLPLTMAAYSGVVLLLMLLPATVTARPRFLYTALPLLIAAAVWIERHRRHWWPSVYAACAVGLVALTTLYGVYGAIP